MAKQSGLGDRLYYGGHDIAGDIGSLGRIGGGPAALDVTDITQEGHSRIGGRFDAEMSFTSYFNPAPGRAHEVFGALPTGHQVLTYLRGTALGAAGAGLIAKQLGYDGTRAQDGGYTFAIAAQASDGTGMEWGQQLTPGARTDTGAATGASVDLGSASPGAFGLVTYLQVLDFTGTDATVKVQQSSDAGAGDPWADITGAAFTQVTGRTAERIATAAIDIERHLRVVTTTAGGFTSLRFVVIAVRYPVPREF
ncbi:MAG TPA: hypothetical protein VGD67_12125 [Pseudonocardiaceae bacterium]